MNKNIKLIKSFSIILLSFSLFGLMADAAILRLKENKEKLASPVIKQLPSPSPEFYSPSPKATIPSYELKNSYKKNLITCTGPDGKTFSTTQEECDKFNSAWNNNPSPISSSVPTQRYENFTTTKQPPCVIGSNTYYYTPPEICEQWKQEDQLLNQQYSTYTGSNGNTYYDNSAEIEACKAIARDNYQIASQQAVAYGGTVGNAMQEIALSNFNNAMAACDNL